MDLEIGLTTILLLCKFLKASRVRLTSNISLMLFGSALLTALKLTYETVSPQFVLYVRDVLKTDTAAIVSMERVFLKALNFNLTMDAGSFRKLQLLMMQ